MSYFIDENRNLLDYYGLRQPAIKQELMPSNLNISKPTRDVSAYSRSHSLNKQQFAIPSNTKILLQKRVIQLQKELEECDFQRQANIVYNKQFRELGRLLGDENMQFDQIRGKIQDMILQGPSQNRGTHSQTNLNLNENLIFSHKEQIQQLKFELASQRNIKYTLIQKVQRYQRIQSQIRLQNIQLKSKIQHNRRQLQSSNNMRHLNQPFSSREHLSSRQNISTKSKQLINYNGMQVSSTNLVYKLKQKDIQIDQKSNKIQELLARLQKIDYHTAQKDNMQSQFTRKYNEIQQKYQYYVKQYNKLQQQLKNYEHKIRQNEVAMQRYQEMEDSFQLLQRNYAQMQNKLQQSKKYQDQVNKQNSQARNKLVQFQSNFAEFQTRQLENKSKQSALHSKLVQHEQQILSLQNQIGLRNQQITAHKQKVRQEQNQIIKLGYYIDTLNEDLKRHQENSQLAINRADQLVYKQLVIQQNQSTFQQYREQISQCKLQVSQLKKQIEQLNQQISQKKSQLTVKSSQLTAKSLQLSSKQSQIIDLTEQLQYKTSQLNNYETKNVELKQSYQRLNVLYDSKSTQILDLALKYQHIKQRNQQLKIQRQKILQFHTSSNNQQLQQHTNSQSFEVNNLIYETNLNRQQNSHVSMQRIQNLDSNVNQNDQHALNHITRTGEFAVNNTIQGSHMSYKQQQRHQPFNMNNNDKQNFSSIQRSQVQYKIISYNSPLQQSNHNVGEVIYSNQQLSYNNNSGDKKQIQAHNSSQKIQLVELFQKISYLQAQLNIARKSSDSKNIQIKILEKRLQQLQILVQELNRKIDSFQLHQSSSRQQAKQYSGNFGNQASNNFQATVRQNHANRFTSVTSNVQNLQQIQVISRLSKNICVLQSWSKKGIQGQLSGSSFKCYSKKSSEDNVHDVQDQYNSICDKTNSIQNGNASKIDTQQQQLNMQQARKSARQSKGHLDIDDLSHKVLDQLHENSLMSEHSLSKLVMGQNSVHNKHAQSGSRIQNSSVGVEQAKQQRYSNPSIHEKQSSHSIQKKQSNPSIQEKQSNPSIQEKQSSHSIQKKQSNPSIQEKQSNHSIHEKINDFSMDRESIHSHQTANNKQSFNAGYELPQFSKKPAAGQLETVPNQLAVDEIPKNYIEQTKRMSQVVANKSVYHQNLTNVYNDSNRPLSTITSNPNIESARQGSKRSNSISSQKRQLSNSLINNSKRASPSPGKISISYGRESKIIYTTNIKQSQNCIKYADRRTTLPLVNKKQMIDVNATIRHPQQINSNNHIIFNNNLRSSRAACDNNATVRPYSKQMSRQFHAVSRFRCPDSRKLSRDDIQRQTLVNDQYLPVNVNTLVRSISPPPIRSIYDNQAMYKHNYVRQKAKINQKIIYMNPISLRNSQISNSVHSNNEGRLGVDQSQSQICCGISPPHYSQQYKKSGISNSQMSKFNAVKQSKITSPNHSQTSTLRNQQHRCSFAQRIQQQQTYPLANSAIAKNSFSEDANVNNLSQSSQDSGINVFQNQTSGFNFCSG